MKYNDFASDVRYAEARIPTYGNHWPKNSTGVIPPPLLPLSSKKATNRYVKILIIVAIFLALSCVLLAVCIAVLFAKLERVQDELGDYSSTVADRKICFPCSQLNVSRFDPDEEADLNLLEVTVDDNGDKVCCARDARQTKSLLELVYKKNTKTSCFKGTGVTEPSCNSSSLYTTTNVGVSGAHLLAGLQTWDHNDGDTGLVQNWRTDDVTSYIEGIQLTRDRLVVNDTGLYLVYSQVYFSKYVVRTALRSAVLLQHSVYRYNTIHPNSGNQALMDNYRTMIFDPLTSYSELTSFTAAVLQLSVGDQIYVKISNISLMSRDEKASFLGMVQLE